MKARIINTLTQAPASQGVSHSKRPAIMTTLKRWSDNIYNRNALARLDERLLRDCGITEAQRHHEISKPFWR
ncbi:DUF1127 domain-containing protein [Pseudomonas amygdali]|uniref:YjiS-like domain-containing protein n=2 Tax=Pseudomonas amygdali pv. lachrymans TaxID=53707 RepID=A0ABR5KU49_PSEAV|nr:DUF1127 domain-containing protein [Pseudomonas amygdali]AXH59660.1 DUF1127 domain-containing protein [Pseudomonas amygdali pv. lachrymans str. M301315]KPC17087.1 Uncharacterized protein AC499_0289 [Pseudomonas amygdali pv. lachrymans]KPC18046.1 Uncharacterized protein AC499_1248 [Pseudomonas amygdali pv. lachrymans]RMT05804.1 hypothetical protein ALP54_102291 [Pseudomonas amygdali pv. lachrymans]